MGSWAPLSSTWGFHPGSKAVGSCLTISPLMGKEERPGDRRPSVVPGTSCDVSSHSIGQIWLCGHT